MKSFALIAGFIASAVMAAPQLPPGCSASYPGGTFITTTLNATGFMQPGKFLFDRRSAPATFTLQNGNLVDESGKIGYIASNGQYQFDNPIQPGGYDAGDFGYCPNNTLSVAGSTIFYSCISGGFSNLYIKSLGMQCSQVFISIMPASGVTSASAYSGSSVSAMTSSVAASTPSSVAAMTSSVVMSSAAAPAPAPMSTPVTQISDAQPQAATSAPIATPVVNSGAGTNGLSQLALAAGALGLFML